MTLTPGFAWDANVNFLPKHINATIQIVGSTYFWTTTVNNTNQAIDVESDYSTQHHLLATDYSKGDLILLVSL